MRTPFRYVSLLAVGLLIALLAVVAGQGATPSAQALYGDSDGDSTIDVAEVVLGSDPHDAHNTPEDNFTDVVLQTNLCRDGVDNDRDGSIDAADSGCADPDDDIASTPTETLLGSDPNDSGSFPEDARLDAMLQWLGFGFAQACTDGHDNDGDGLTDAAEPMCLGLLSDSDGFADGTEKLFGSNPSDGASVPEHETPNPGSCSDGIDNDRDAMTDGADDGCTPLVNDTIDQATAVGALPFEDSVKVNSAGIDPSEPRGTCYFDAQLSIWYTYTATADGVITADTAGTNFTSAISVFTRSGSRYTEVSCAPIVPNRPFDSPGSHAAIRVTQGETYYIQAIGYIFPGLPNKMRLTVDNAHPPANDNFSSPSQIASLPFSDNVNTLDATSEFGEPVGRCLSPNPVATVWYRYTPQNEALLIAGTRGSSYATALTVWTDSSFGLAEVGCSYSADRVAVRADAGRTYYIQVTSREADRGGSLRFSLIEGQSPANDDFANATNISSLPFAHSVDTFTATSEIGEPQPTCSFGAFANTVWYKTTPQQSGYLEASVETENNSPYTVVGIYQGSSASDLNEVTCVSPYYYYASSAEVGFAVTAGQTYYFQVGALSFGGGKFFGGAGESAGFSTEPGKLTFHLETLVIPSCAPTQFTFSDPLNDQRGGFGPPPSDSDAPPDITSLSGGSDGTNLCIRVEFAGPLPEPSDDPFESRPSARIEFDTDEDVNTQYYSRLSYDCGATLGVEAAAQFDLRRNVLVPLEMPFRFEGGGSFPPPEEEPYGFVTYGERSLEFIVPLDALGGDDHLRLAFALYGATGYDCIPDNGVVVSPDAPPPGDVNCDGATNSLDSVLILQRFANLLFQPLPCEYAGDVNQNGGVGPIDAALILQYNAGMLAEFSPAG